MTNLSELNLIREFSKYKKIEKPSIALSVYNPQAYYIAKEYQEAKKLVSNLDDKIRNHKRFVAKSINLNF